MKVLLKKDVDSLGYAGDVYEVAPGYGRNYLLPRGLAVMATPSVMKAANAWRDRAAARRAELRAEFEALAERINALSLEFERKAGETGRLYGSVTTNDIADAMNEALGTEIDRRKVLGESLRSLGEHTLIVRLSQDVEANLTVNVTPEGGVMPEPVVADEEDDEDEDEDEFEDDYDDYDDYK
jgi:large subunit ribosomal protein L9